MSEESGVLYKSGIGVYKAPEISEEENSICTFERYQGVEFTILHSSSTGNAEVCYPPESVIENIDARYQAAEEAYEEGRFEDAFWLYRSLYAYNGADKKLLTDQNLNKGLSKYRQMVSDKLKTYQPGASVQFGSWERDNNTINGQEPIEWWIIGIEDNKMQLLSKNILDVQPYNDVARNLADTTWENCTLRAWLNDEFLNGAFSADEQEMISSVPRITQEYDFSMVTTEKITLLRSPDVFQNLLFGEHDWKWITENIWACSPTAYAAAQRESLDMGEDIDWRYWCCGAGATQGHGNHGNGDGGFTFPPDQPHLSHTDVDDSAVGVRPVIWLDLSRAIEYLN